MSENQDKYNSKHILFCYCGGERIPQELLDATDESIRTLPVQVTRFSDLCGLAAKGKDLPSFSDDTDYLIIGCYKRSMKPLLEKFQPVGFNAEGLQYINLIEETKKEQILAEINAFCDTAQGSGHYSEIKEDSGWPSWYPIIDYSRCINCGQCADFCLFGVYEKTAGKVRVVNPSGCKNNCPACARICPSTAIIFPKYKNGGAIGGSEEIDEFAEQQRKVADIESIMGDDIYLALQQRKAKRQSIIRDEVMRKAREEREKALDETKKTE